MKMKDENGVELKIDNIIAIPDIYWEHGEPHPRFTYFVVQSFGGEGALTFAEGPIISLPSKKIYHNLTVKVYQGNRCLVVEK